MVEHVKAQDVSTEYRDLAKQLSPGALRRKMNRHADVTISGSDSPVSAALRTHDALGNPRNVVIHNNSDLWVMNKRNWTNLTRSLLDADITAAPDVAPATPPRPAPVRAESRRSARVSSILDLLGESGPRPLTESAVEDCENDMPTPIPAIAEVAGMRVGDKERTNVQYEVQKGGSFQPTGPTTETLKAGLYKVGSDPYGNPTFVKHRLSSDKLLRFEDARYKMVLDKIGNFWSLRQKYMESGLVHKRGMMLFGPPGSGKSCLLKQVMEDAVARGNIVLITDNTRLLAAALPMLQEVEADRQILVIMEDVDEMGEHSLLQLFDGDNTVENVCYLGTTNYIERLAPRVLRPGRFDDKIEIGPPPATGRQAYFEAKFLPLGYQPEQVMEFVKLTDGFSFGQLREFLVSVHCYGQTGEEAASRLSNGGFIYESCISEDTAEFLLSGRQILNG